MAPISLSIAVSHAIAFLTGPLVGTLAQETIDRLRLALESNLVKEFEPIWHPADPDRDSGARCLTLSPHRLPPRPIRVSCHAVRLAWTPWILALGGEMDLFIDPGCVSVRRGAWGSEYASEAYLIWSAPVQQPVFETAVHRQTTMLEQVDEDADEIFMLIDRELSAPSWLSPILQRFPAVPHTITVEPDAFVSRSSSRTSMRTSNSDFSLPDNVSITSLSRPPSLIESESNDSRLSADSISSSIFDGLVFGQDSCSSSSADDTSDSSSTRAPRKTRRSRQNRVHIDASKVDVTPYDGGKTTVLTGGVMLGPAPKKGKGARA